MRTTINLQEEALALCKKQAQAQGTSLGQVISAAVLSVYRDRPVRASRGKTDLPVSGKGGLQPGVDLDSTAALEDIMEDRG